MDRNVKPVQSAELPVMPNSVARVVRLLDDGENYDTIYKAIVDSDMVDGITDKRCFDKQTLKSLMYSMSRSMLRSVLLKTLGPDLYDQGFYSKANWENVLGDKGPGAYVVFITVRERKGKFLCVRELKELIRILNQYARAIDAIEEQATREYEYGASQFGDDDRAAMLLAMEVDDVLRGKNSQHNLRSPRFDNFEPRFRSGAGDRTPGRDQGVPRSDNVRSLVKMLEKRCLEGVDEEVYQLQSPLLVGNARDIDTRAASHLPRNSMSNSPKIWALLISCLMVMKVNIRVQYATMFRAWVDEAQINDAEILGTAVAGSLLSVDGCNAKQPGTRSLGGVSEIVFGDSHRHVSVECKWYTKNLNQTRVTLPLSAEAIELEAREKEVLDNAAEMLQAEKEYKDALAMLAAANGEFDKALEEANDNVNEAEEFIATLASESLPED
ncbi:hypothetical protein GGR54DRAFT_645494 [Hypoxylon sp. NC1633]|nr:hypothetical protein GGR54DRAFT_645494 [Hypoxylon sp. NC1633]